MFVAMPTAMPAAPFTSRFGKPDGATEGSESLASKLGTKSTVSRSRSRSISSPIFDIRASVYLYAAAGSPSTEPKLPWPSMRGCRREKLWAMRTMES